MHYTFIFVVVLAFIEFSETAKILGILHVPGRSHYQAGSTLLKILAEDGHEVTVVSPFKEKNPPPNYRDVVMTGALEKWEKMNTNFFARNMNILQFPINFNYRASFMMEDLFNCTNFKNLMNSGEHFDLVIMEQFGADAVKYAAHHFKAPLIVYTAIEANEWVNPYQGNLDNPSYAPHFVLNYNTHMKFFERVINTLTYLYIHIFRVMIYIPNQNKVLHKFYPDAPDITEIIDKVALVFANTDPSTHEPLPRVPSIIGVGGFHIQKPKPLPNDIKKILDNATNGVIVFSMGSNLKSKQMPLEQRKVFLEAFQNLKATVIWKFEDENLPEKSENVIIRQWLPQNDMLAHKNVKLFITHGGIFSTMEAVYHGIPILAIPIYGDQAQNAKRATANGYARWLDFKTMTAKDLETSIKDLLTDPKYTENAKMRSSLMKDKPRTPQDTIKFWADHVIRHKGADHLRVAALNLSWCQYVLLDVVAFILVVIVALIYLLRCFLRKISSIFRKKTQLKQKKE